MQPPDKHILVIDDNEITQTVLRAVLEYDGFNVFTCPDAHSALVSSKARDFCVYVVDYQLPGMKGDALAAALRQARPDSVIIGCSLELREQEFLSAGADGFLLKENVPSQLLSVLTTSLSSR